MIIQTLIKIITRPNTLKPFSHFRGLVCGVGHQHLHCMGDTSYEAYFTLGYLSYVYCIKKFIY